MLNFNNTIHPKSPFTRVVYCSYTRRCIRFPIRYSQGHLPAHVCKIARIPSLHPLCVGDVQKHFCLKSASTDKYTYITLGRGHLLRLSFYKATLTPRQTARLLKLSTSCLHLCIEKIFLILDSSISMLMSEMRFFRSYCTCRDEK